MNKSLMNIRPVKPRLELNPEQRDLLLDNGDLATAEDMARYLKVTRQTILRMCRSGQLPYMKFGKLYYLSKSMVSMIMEKRLQASYNKVVSAMEEGAKKEVD